ncbi:MAG: hypothetical protein HYR84_11235, partial [Planctomycetes bacterium]|nr:hypothetical protein [Planctomycetota bacterium]
MAVSTTFKQQCPSCEAMITIREGMIGKKVECNKCKDTFVAKRPVDDVDEVDGLDEEEVSQKKDTKLNGKKKTSMSTGVSAKTPPPKGKRPKLDLPQDDVDDDVDEVEETDDAPKSKSSANKAASNGKASKSDEPDDEADNEDQPKKKKKDKAGNSNKLMVGLGLAIVGVAILGVAAYFYFNNSDKTNAPPPQAGGGQGGGLAPPPPPPPPPGGGKENPANGKNDPKGPNAGNKDPFDGKKPIDIRPSNRAQEFSEAIQAQLSNLLPNDTEHVSHYANRNIFETNGPLLQAVFEAPGGLNDKDLQKKLGFSILAIEDLIVAEKYTAPGWKYTVLHFKDLINENALFAAMRLDPITIEGKTCYRTLKAHPWFDQLARFSFGVPNHLRALDNRPRDRSSYMCLHTPQTLIIGDEIPVKAFLKAKGKFPMLSTPKSPPVNPNPGGVGGGTPIPGGMMGGVPPGGMKGLPPPGGMMGVPPPGGMIGGVAPPPPPPGGGVATPPIPPPPGKSSFDGRPSSTSVSWAPTGYYNPAAAAIHGSSNNKREITRFAFAQTVPPPPPPPPTGSAAGNPPGMMGGTPIGPTGMGGATGMIG